MTHEQFEALANFIAANAAFYSSLGRRTPEEVDEARHVLHCAEVHARRALVEDKQ